MDGLDALTRRFQGDGVDAIVAIGGGSVIDAAKVLAVTLPLDDVARDGWIAGLRTQAPQTWTRRVPVVVAIPTTAGTGAEVTPFATVWDAQARRKYSVTGPLVFPTVALLDPELTRTMSRATTLFTGMDALSHALESLWNRNRTPVSVAHAAAALRLIVDALPGLLHGVDDLEARARMLFAGTLSGLAISTTRTATAHALSYGVTAHFGAPHGLASSFTLREILRQNHARVAETLQDAALVQRVAELLARVQLDREIRRFVTPEGLQALRGEGLNADRAANFDGALDCPPFELMTRSL
jgi:alcohol dehydrogenase